MRSSNEIKAELDAVAADIATTEQELGAAHARGDAPQIAELSERLGSLDRQRRGLNAALPIAVAEEERVAAENRRSEALVRVSRYYNLWAVDLEHRARIAEAAAALEAAREARRRAVDPEELDTLRLRIGGIVPFDNGDRFIQPTQPAELRAEAERFRRMAAEVVAGIDPATVRPTKVRPPQPSPEEVAAFKRGKFLVARLAQLKHWLPLVQSNRNEAEIAVVEQEIADLERERAERAAATAS